MTIQNTRREILRGSLAVAGLSALGIPDWVLPALAQGETVVPFTDIPDNLRWEPPPDRRLLDIRTIDGPFTPKDKFATTQHYGHPGRRPGDVQAEGLGPGRPAEGAVARRSQEVGQRPIWSPASSARATAGRSRGCAATASGPACR